MLRLSIYRVQVSDCIAFRSIEHKYPRAAPFDLSSLSVRVLRLSIHRTELSACIAFRSIEPKYPHAAPFDLSSPSFRVLYPWTPRRCERWPSCTHVAGRKNVLRSDCSNCCITGSWGVIDDKQGAGYFKWTGGQQELMCASSHPAAKCCKGQMPSSVSQSEGVWKSRIYKLHIV
jgi:hypothetical protein